MHLLVSFLQTAAQKHGAARCGPWTEGYIFYCPKAHLVFMKDSYAINGDSWAGAHLVVASGLRAGKSLPPPRLRCRAGKERTGSHVPRCQWNTQHRWPPLSGMKLRFPLPMTWVIFVLYNNIGLCCRLNCNPPEDMLKS